MLGLAITILRSSYDILVGVSMILGGIRIIKNAINEYRMTRACPA